MTYTFRNAQDAFITLGKDILMIGNEYSPRGKKTKEFPPVMITLVNPLERCFFVPGRNDNVFAKVAETLWQMAGRDDIDWLSFYLPRAVDYSDNGRTWRGAYGPRLRNWNGSDNVVDQVKEVANLHKDRYSRQAVISIWDPSRDITAVTKDRPCNNWLQFLIRDGKLIMNVTQRSCDLLWGYSGIDTFSWSVLQQMMAYWTNSEVGSFNHFIGSLHVYEQHWGRLQRIVNDYYMVSYSAYTDGFELRAPTFETPFEELDRNLNQIFNMEKHADQGIASGIADFLDYYDEWDAFDDEFFVTCFQMLMIFKYYKRLKYNQVALTYMLDAMSQTDLRLAAIEYIARDHKDILEKIYLSDVERNVLTRVYKLASNLEV